MLNQITRVDIPNVLLTSVIPKIPEILQLHYNSRYVIAIVSLFISPSFLRNFNERLASYMRTAMDIPLKGKKYNRKESVKDMGAQMS